MKTQNVLFWRQGHIRGELNTDDVLGWETKEPSTATFSFSYLKDIVKAAEKVWDVACIELSTDMSIKISLYPTNNVVLTYYLAPESSPPSTLFRGTLRSRIDIIRDEYIELILADELDDVDTSLLTLFYCSKRIAEIRRKYPEDIKNWDNFLLQRLANVTHYSGGAPILKPLGGI
jgi:hypothetical protein